MEFEEIQERLKIITKTPIKLIPDDKMAKIRKDMAIKCPITKKMDEQFRTHIAGGTEHQLTIKDPSFLPSSVLLELECGIWMITNTLIG